MDVKNLSQKIKKDIVHRWLDGLITYKIPRDIVKKIPDMPWYKQIYKAGTEFYLKESELIHFIYKYKFYW